MEVISKLMTTGYVTVIDFLEMTVWCLSLL